MRISLDFTSAIGDRTGVGTYTAELARALLPRVRNPPLRLAVHAYRHPGWRARIAERLAGIPGRYGIAANRLVPHGLLLRAEHRLGVPPLEALFGPADVFHGTNFLAPPALRARVVVTVHDLAFVRFQAEIPVPHRYARYIGRSLARADRILAVSEATRRDLVDLFGIEPGRITVVPEAAPTDRRECSPETFRALRRRWGLPERFFLFLGTLEPRKNLPRLVRAFQGAAARIPGPIGLLLAGRRGWAFGELAAALREARRGVPVIAPGFLETAVKNAALRHAVALAFPSLYEGFGLPVLEAFRAGTPVLAANAGALPEVAGDAAVLVDPRSEAELEEALVRLATDPDLARSLADRGRERETRYSWSRTARATLAAYRETTHTEPDPRCPLSPPPLPADSAAGRESPPGDCQEA